MKTPTRNVGWMDVGAHLYGNYPALPSRTPCSLKIFGHMSADRPASADSQTRNKSMAPDPTNTTAIATMTAVRLLLTAAARKPEITLSVSMINMATTASK
jgi:hypothetical protein